MTIYSNQKIIASAELHHFILNGSNCFCVLLFSGVFHLVEFTDSKTAAVVSSEWMIGKESCCYPKWQDKKVKLAALKHVIPEDSWEIFSVRIVITKGLNSLFMALFRHCYRLGLFWPQH